ncbi:TPA: hypothetical protein SD378_000194 [Morganella morganii]|nr:hypothetical protein [Morganella morganii]HEG4391637.1 hypothetical protein [Morganella morganii]
MSLMTAKQKHAKEQVIELFNQADMDEKQIEQIVSEWRWRRENAKTNRILHQCRMRLPA